MEQDHRIEKVFSSKIHGYPATPVFQSFAGDRVVFRTVMPADKPRNVGFAVHGHMWKEQNRDPFSRVIPLQGAISIGNNKIEKSSSANTSREWFAELFLMAQLL